MKKVYTEDELPQGSDEWLEIRKKYGTASEAAAACEVSPWNPKNRYELYQLKKGNMQIDMTFAMAHGHKYEDEARQFIQDKLNKVFEPLCITNKIQGLPLMASLDGMEQLTGNSILEIKCPLKGCNSPLWKAMVDKAELPIHYQLQMTQQMLLAEVDECHFFVYCAETKQGQHRVFKKNKKLVKQLLNGWEEFFKGEPIPATTDVVEINTKEWNDLTNDWLVAKHKADEAAKELDDIRVKLLEVCNGQSYKGNGVIIKYNDKGMANVRKA